MVEEVYGQMDLQALPLAELWTSSCPRLSPHGVAPIPSFLIPALPQAPLLSSHFPQIAGVTAH